jgi:Nif-specific regulatory protein
LHTTLNRETMVIVKQLEALSAIAEIIAFRSEEQEMLVNILDVLESKLRMQRGTIMLLTPNTMELAVEAVPSRTSSVNPKAKYRLGEGIMGKVVETGKSAVVPRISEEPLFRDRIHNRRDSNTGDGAFICIPVKIGNDILGVLAEDLPGCDEPLELAEAERLLNIVGSMIAHSVKARHAARQEREALEQENNRLRDALGESFRPESIIGNSLTMREVYLRLHQVSRADTTVLIRGESGTGKELIAAAIHYQSGRSQKKLIKVNCAALNENILESELFGHEKGSFTGAVQTRIGRIEEAEGGSLFLDEIGEISPALQAKLLRFLQEREFERMGSNRTIHADVRVIAATNRNLEEAVKQNTFRQDLYYRINVFPVYLPPLRERKEDILPLANFFVERYAAKTGKPVRRISTPAIAMMAAYHWPGNIRELENCIEHAVLVSSDGVIHGGDLPPTLQIPSNGEIKGSGKLIQRVESLEKEMIVDALKHAGGNKTAAAMDLGVSLRILRYKIKMLRIDCPQYFNYPRKR